MKGNFCIQGHRFSVHRKRGRILRTHKRNSNEQIQTFSPFVHMELSCKTTDYSRKTENHAAGNQPLAGSVWRQDGRGVLVGRALKHTLLPKLARKSMPVKVGTFLGVLQGHISGPSLLPCADSQICTFRGIRRCCRSPSSPPPAFLSISTHSYIFLFSHNHHPHPHPHPILLWVQTVLSGFFPNPRLLVLHVSCFLQLPHLSEPWLRFESCISNLLSSRALTGAPLPASLL